MAKKNFTKIHKSHGMYETAFEEKASKLINRLEEKGSDLPYEKVSRIENDIFTEKIETTKDVDNAVKKARYEK